jgi:hypothetical protein
MTTYKPQGVDVTILDNPNIINTAGVKRVPAIIGMGPSTLTVTDEAVVRGSGSSDVLGYTPTSITKISNTPGVTGGLSYTLISTNGNLYQSSSASVSGGGVAWSGSGVDIPSAGNAYYISYVAALPSSQYDPTEYFDKATILNAKGQESTSTGILSIAGSIVLENGSPSVILVQASGSAYSETAYKTAIDKLMKKSNISYVLAVFPSGSVTRANQESLQTYLLSHAQLMSNNKKERGFISGSPSVYTTSDGFDTIGDTSTNPSYVYRANALNNRNNIYVVPSYCTRVDANGNTMLLDGNYAAAAVAGVLASKDKESTPINGFAVTGISILDEKWNEFELNQLGAGNCLALISNAGVCTINRSLTTDPTSADTQEPSVVDIQRLVKRTLRTGLENTYTNKGKVITSGTVNDVISTNISLYQSLITDGEIAAYGQEDNPLTGETKISAKRDPSEPRKIIVTSSYSPLYPLIWISETINVYF